MAVQIPLGLFMAYRGNTLNLDGLTNALYSSHKLLGITILAAGPGAAHLPSSHGAPPDEPTLERWQKGAGHLKHWGLYLALLVVPILGYIGISLYPALDIFGLFSLPGVVAPNQEAAATQCSTGTGWPPVPIVLLVGMHVGGRALHYFIRKDGVLRRMWVRAGRLS